MRVIFASACVACLSDLVRHVYLLSLEIISLNIQTCYSIAALQTLSKMVANATKTNKQKKCDT